MPVTRLKIDLKNQTFEADGEYEPNEHLNNMFTSFINALGNDIPQQIEDLTRKVSDSTDSVKNVVDSNTPTA